MQSTTTKEYTMKNIEQLRTAYMVVFNGFAVSRSELADEMQVSVATASRILNKLRDLHLVEGTDVNDEAQGNMRRGQYSEILWQCWETYDSTDEAGALATFEAAVATPQNTTTTSKEDTKMASKTPSKSNAKPENIMKRNKKGYVAYQVARAAGDTAGMATHKPAYSTYKRAYRAYLAARKADQGQAQEVAA